MSRIKRLESVVKDDSDVFTRSVASEPVTKPRSMTMYALSKTSLDFPVLLQQNRAQRDRGRTMAGKLHISRITKVQTSKRFEQIIEDEEEVDSDEDEIKLVNSYGSGSTDNELSVATGPGTLSDKLNGSDDSFESKATDTQDDINLSEPPPAPFLTQKSHSNSMMSIFSFFTSGNSKSLTTSIDDHDLNLAFEDRPSASKFNVATQKSRNSNLSGDSTAISPRISRNELVIDGAKSPTQLVATQSPQLNTSGTSILSHTTPTKRQSLIFRNDEIISSTTNQLPDSAAPPFPGETGDASLSLTYNNYQSVDEKAKISLLSQRHTTVQPTNYGKAKPTGNLNPNFEMTDNPLRHTKASTLALADSGKPMNSSSNQLTPPNSKPVSLASPRNLTPGESILTQVNKAASKAILQLFGGPKASSKFDKYTRMRAVLPMEAVKHRMMQDGVSLEDRESFFHETPESKIVVPIVTDDPPPPNMKPKIVIKPKKKVKNIFWTKLKNEEIPGTIWERVADLKLPEEAQDVLEELFAATQTSALPVASEAASSNKSKGVSLFDGKRTQNVMIILGRVRKSPVELRNMAITLNPDVLTQAMTEMMMELCPTPEEVTMVKSHNPQDLDTVGKLFYELGAIPRLRTRLELHQIAFKWNGNANNILKNIRTVSSACLEIKTSLEKLCQILSVVLAIGNFLNGGTPRGQAYGLKLDALVALANTKTTRKMNATPASKSDTPPTLLHVVVLEAEKLDNSLLHIFDTWKDVFAAGGVSLKTVEVDIEEQIKCVNQARTEIDQRIPTMLADGTDCRITAPLRRRLTDFLIIAQPQVEKTYSELAATKKELSSIMLLFGEKIPDGEDSGKEGDAGHAFFSTLISFAKLFQQTVTDINRMRERAHQQLLQSRKPNASGKTNNNSNKSLNSTPAHSLADSATAISQRAVSADAVGGPSQALSVSLAHEAMMQRVNLKKTANNKTSNNSSPPDNQNHPNSITVIAEEMRRRRAATAAKLADTSNSGTVAQKSSSSSSPSRALATSASTDDFPSSANESVTTVKSSNAFSPVNLNVDSSVLVPDGKKTSSPTNQDIQDFPNISLDSASIIDNQPINPSEATGANLFNTVDDEIPANKADLHSTQPPFKLESALRYQASLEAARAQSKLKISPVKAARLLSLRCTVATVTLEEKLVNNARDEDKAVLAAAQSTTKEQAAPTIADQIRAAQVRRQLLEKLRKGDSTYDQLSDEAVVHLAVSNYRLSFKFNNTNLGFLASNEMEELRRIVANQTVPIRSIRKSLKQNDAAMAIDKELKTVREAVKKIADPTNSTNSSPSKIIEVNAGPNTNDYFSDEEVEGDDQVRRAISCPEPETEISSLHFLKKQPSLYDIWLKSAAESDMHIEDHDETVAELTTFITDSNMVAPYLTVPSDNSSYVSGARVMSQEQQEI